MNVHDEDKSFDGLTAEECKDKCLRETSYLCKAALYNAEDSFCQISRYNSDSQTANSTNGRNVTLYEIECHLDIPETR